ncbi:MAG: hypothetical protein WBE30_14160, partial [Candidatus Cybelea sp.]
RNPPKVKLSASEFLAGFAVIPGLPLVAIGVYELWRGLAIILAGGPAMADQLRAYAAGGQLSIGILCSLLGAGLWALALRSG